MPKTNSTWKTIVAACAIVAAVGGGGTIGYEAIGARQDAIEESVRELRKTHCSDLAVVREQVTSMRTLLDTVLQHLASTEAKVDIAVKLLREDAAR